MRARYPTPVALVLLALAGLLAAAPPAAAFDGSQEIEIGDRVRATMSGEDGEVHRFPFFATEGAVLRARLTPRDTRLRAAVRLTYPGGAAVPQVKSIGGRRGGALHQRHVFATSGWFVLEVSRRGGKGDYVLRTTGRRAKHLRGLVPGPEADGRFSFGVQQGAKLRVKAAPRNRSRAVPVFRGMTGPDGEPVPAVLSTRGRRALLNHPAVPSSGRHTLLWENVGTQGDVWFLFRFRGPPQPRRVWDLGAADGIASEVVEAGDPLLAAREGYVGSNACGSCHRDISHDWSMTAHNNAVRAWDRAGMSGENVVNDADGNGTNDFEERRNLAGDPAFAAFGADAPRFTFTASAEFPYGVRIGAVEYPVARTMGGNGLWMQRYLTRIGSSYFPLPFQYNEADGTYAPYSADNWYDGTSPRFSSTAQVPAAISFEAQCSGCHNTGEILEFSGGMFMTGYVEMNVGCEQCHGPGAAHAAVGNPALISNPRDRLDGTAAGVAAANAVCARCHDKGHSVDPVTGSSVNAGFGYNAVDGVSQAGDDPRAFLDRSMDPAAFWGFEADPISGSPGNAWAATRGAPQQGLDTDTGGHAPDSGDAPTCFECHGPHRANDRHMLTGGSSRVPGLATRLEDNTLCLSCHAGRRFFESVTTDDVATITTGSAPESVVAAVVDHMRDSGMPIGRGAYDPEGTGAGRCDTCHMLATGVAAKTTTDAAGNALGDITNHSMQPIWPRASELHGVTNSCTPCHVAGTPDDKAAEIIDQWVHDGADGDGTFHADTPRGFQNGIANPERSGGVRCAGCHTTEGFLRIQIAGEDPSQDEIDEIVRQAVGRDEGITCQACHGRDANGDFNAGPNSLRVPAADLCGSCHNNETVVFADFRDHGEIVRHPQREMILGTAGDDPTLASAVTPHSDPGLFPKNCVDCHYDRAKRTEKHDFTPLPSTCGRCHDEETFNRTAFADFDGSGTVDGIQTEVGSLLAILRDALLAQPLVTQDASGYFQYDGGTDRAMTGATEGQKRAAFNYYSISFDGSLGVHNPARAVRVLQRSYREITGVDVPGAFIR